MKNEKVHYIYGWKDLITNNFFYIGAGKYQKLAKYPRSYCIHYYKKREKTRAQYKREKLGEFCSIEILYDELTLDERNIKEQELIELYKTIDNGGILYNHTKGGDYNPMFDEKILEKHRNMMQSEEMRQKRRESAANFMQSEEYKEKISKIGKEVWSRDGYRENYMQIYTPEFREQMTLSQKNRQEIEFNGVIYPSKKALARFLEISSQLLNYRLKNDIRLDKPL